MNITPASIPITHPAAFSLFRQFPLLPWSTWNWGMSSPSLPSKPSLPRERYFVHHLLFFSGPLQFPCLFNGINFYFIQQRRPMDHSHATKQCFSHSANISWVFSKCQCHDKHCAFILADCPTRSVFLSQIYKWGNGGLKNSIPHPRSHSLDLNAHLLCFGRAVFIHYLLLNI